MKLRYIIIFLIILSAVVLVGKMSLKSSEGLKYGTLQKVSHKQFPCSYYVAEFSFEGGRVEGDDQAKAYSNTQEVEITKEAFDTLQNYMGEKVIFDYTDRGYVVCGESKKLTSIRRKQKNE